MAKNGLCRSRRAPMLNLYFLLALTLTAFANTDAAAKSQRKVYTSRADLPNLHVNALAQDSLGYIWVGTANGLCRDKGNAYDIFSSDKADSATIPSNNVTALLYQIGRASCRERVFYSV